MSAPKTDNRETLLAAATILLVLSPTLDPLVTCRIAAGFLAITLARGLLARSGRRKALQ